MSTKLAVARDTVLFSASTLVSQGAAFFVAVWIRRVLGPEAMGIWALLQVVQSYIAYTNLGMMNAVFREVPVMRGRGESPEEIEAVKKVGYTYLSGAAFVTAALVAAAALVLRPSLSPVVFSGLWVVAVMTLFERTIGFIVQTLYIEKKFETVSRFRIWSTAVNTALVGILSWRAGLYGFYAAIVFSHVFDYVYLRKCSGVSLDLSWDSRRMFRLLRIGIPIFALGFAATFFNTADRVAIGKFLGLKALGVYSIALLAGRYVFLVPNLFQIVILPATLEKFGDEANIEGRRRYALLPGRIMAAYFSLTSAFIWITAPFLCAVVLPQYTAGVPALKALIFGYAFMALAQQMGHILLGFKLHPWMIPVLVALGAGMLSLDRGIAHSGGGIAAIGLAMTLFQLVNYFITALLGLWRTHGGRNGLRELFINLLPIGFSATLLIALDALWPGVSWGGMLAKLAVYYALWAVFLLATEKKTGIIKVFVETFEAWRARRKVEIA